MELAPTEAAPRMYQLDLSLKANQNIPFPWKLHAMLETCEREGLSHIVSWLPDNTSFRVHNPGVFMKTIIVNYFKQTKYKSFQRQLNIWGFQRIISGPNKGGYSHNFFVRSRESLCCMMSRQKIKSEKPAKPRPYFPFKAIASHAGMNRGVNTIRRVSLEDQGLNMLLGKATKSEDVFLPINRLSRDNMPGSTPKGMVPFNCMPQSDMSSTPRKSSNLLVRMVSSMNCGDPDSTPSMFGDNEVSTSPRGVEAFSSSNNKNIITPLAITEECMAPSFRNVIQDESTSSTHQQLPDISPNPIAPDHPLLTRLQRKNDASISNVIDDLVNDNIPTHEEMQEDFSLFEDRNFFSLGERLDRRSSLGFFPLEERVDRRSSLGA